MLFQMLQTRVENFFNPTQFRAPKIAHVIETPINMIEAFFDDRKAGIDVARQDCDQQSVEQDRQADSEIELLVAHAQT